MTKSRNIKIAVWLLVLAALGAAVALYACAPNANNAGRADQKATQKPVAKQVQQTPEADEYGVVEAESWAKDYPNQYQTYLANSENSPSSGKHNYLELYPALNTMYKGYAFALGYDEASSHTYSLESVKNTPRTIKKEQLANCISCKTPQFTATVNSGNTDIYKQKFTDTIGQYTENISCYNCHENDPSSLTVGNKFFIKSLGVDATNYSKAPLASQTCGQCHNEYYFDSTTKEPLNPYSGTAEMTPDAILAYYDSKNFSDWNHGSTGAPMIKVQHPEFETVYGGSSTTMARIGYTCADCHMGTEKDSSGSAYSSHTWKSPLENEDLIKNDCSNCHADLKSEVAATQNAEEARVTAISEKIESMTNKIADKYASEIATIKTARDAGEKPAASENLAKLWKLQRNAQFYWDFVMVENSEGAHNPTLTNETLDKAEAAANEALALLA